ncbi:MAG: ornithine cyclodeaminase family protein [Eubacteriales bacterium]
MKTLILTQADVKKLLNMPDAIKDVEIAYKSYNSGEVVQPPIQSIIMPELNAETDVKSSFSKATNMTCVKAAPGYWDNLKKYNMPTLFATINLFHGDHGFPVCMMEATLITGVRTGAAGGVAARALARPDSKVVGIIGAGNQARMQLRAIKEVMPGITEVKVWSPVPGEADLYKRDMQNELSLNIQPCEFAKDVCIGSDIIVTVTPGGKPIVMDEWVGPGTHITAIGADVEGKQELDVNIFKRAKVIVDSIEQCTGGGETRNSIIAGVFSAERIHAEIGEVLLGKKTGRTSAEEITVFDSTGMSIQDNATAAGIYKRALEQGIGMNIDFI